MNGKITITGGKVTAKATKEAAGIGGGNCWTGHGGGNCGEVEINLTKSDDYVLALPDDDSAAIGHGDGGNSSNDGTLTLGEGSTDYLSVKTMAAASEYATVNGQTPVAASERVSECRSESNKSVLVQYCKDTHTDALVYTKLDESEHRVYCPYCDYSEKEAHDTSAAANCAKCGSGKCQITFKLGDPSQDWLTIAVKSNSSFALPEPDASKTPSGKGFIGWKKDSSTSDVEQPKTAHTPSSDETWVAVYGDTAIISFEPGNGSGSMPSVTTAVGAKYTLPPHQFTAPTGADFTGWSDGSVTYQAGETYTVKAVSTNLTAQWTAHTHAMVHYVAVAATCETSGSIEYWQCSICERLFKDSEGNSEIVNKGDVVIPATGHLWSDPTYIWKDDYSEVTAEMVCMNDPGQQHKVSETVSTTSTTTGVTCTKEGETVYTASFSNRAFENQTKTVTTNKSEHNWGAWESKDGTTDVRTCSVCGAKEERVMGHVHSFEAVAQKDPMCLESGTKAYWKCTGCGKWYADNAGNQEIVGENDDQRLASWRIPAFGHNYTVASASTIKEATCEETGVVRVTHTCSRCGGSYDDYPSTPELGHDWDKGVITAESTCAQGGTKHYTCLREDCGETQDVEIAALDHEWGEWTVTKAATTSEEGVETRTCSVCGEKETRAIPKVTPSDDGKKDASQGGQTGSDGTALGPGASAETAEQAILAMVGDDDKAGSKIAPLKVKSTKQTKKSVKVTWTKLKKAAKYVVYGNRCGKKYEMKKLAQVKTNEKNFAKIAGKKVKKGVSYKFVVVALDKNGKVVSTSKVIHVVAAGGKTGNYKSVTVKKAVVDKAKKLKVGKSLKLKAKAVPKSKKLKVKTHVKLRYESSKESVATVSGKGVVKAKGKGTCYVYAYAQNGVCKKVKVVVK